MSALTHALTLQHLEIFVYLGWEATERKERQKVILDLELLFKLPPRACETDELSDSVCYAALIHQLTAYLHNQEFRLLEYLGKKIYDFIKSYSPQLACRIHLTKFPAVSGLKSARFTYGDHFIQ